MPERNQHIEVRVGNIDAAVNRLGNSQAAILTTGAGTDTIVDVSQRVRCCFGGYEKTS